MGEDSHFEASVIYGGADNSLYTCLIGSCEYTSNASENMRSHIRHSHAQHRGTVNFEFKCSKCFHVVCGTNDSSIERHYGECVFLIYDQPAYRLSHQCPDCERAFYHSLALKNHRISHQVGESSVGRVLRTNTVATTSVYTLAWTYHRPHEKVCAPCPICTRSGRRQRTYSSLSKLKTHLRYIHGVSEIALSVTCGLCGHVLPPSGNLHGADAHYRACRNNIIPFTGAADSSLLEHLSPPSHNTTLVDDLPGSNEPSEESNTSHHENTITTLVEGSQGRLETGAAQYTSNNHNAEAGMSPTLPSNEGDTNAEANTLVPPQIQITSSPTNINQLLRDDTTTQIEQETPNNTIGLSNTSPHQSHHNTPIHYNTQPQTSTPITTQAHKADRPPIDTQSNTQVPNNFQHNTNQNTSQNPSPIIPHDLFTFTPGELVEARASLRRLVDAHSPHTSFDDLETGFNHWCECATAGFAKKKSTPQTGQYNAGAHARSIRNRDEPWSGVGKRTRYRKNVALRRAFTRDQKGTVRKILEGKESGTRCPMSGEKLRKDFGETYSLPDDQRHRKPLPKWMESPSNLPASSQPDYNYPITEEEVEAAITSRDLSSSPGLDGLTYAFWKTLDPKGKLLARLFELCRVKGKIFASWRRSRVTLICKDTNGDLYKIGNWRPIAVCDTLYRLYTCVIAKRVTSWAREQNVISSNQKGFMPVEGVFEHLFMLDEIIADAKTSHRALSVTWLDIRNAFGSVRPDCISQVLEHFHAPTYLLEVVSDLYSSGSFTLRGGDGVTVDVTTQKGVRQGCPLSGILFNMVLEVLLRGLRDSSSDGYNLGWKKRNLVQSLAYADDICLVTKSRQQMINQLKKCEKFASWAGFEFNNKKCASMCMSSRPGGAEPRPLPFCNGEVRVLSRDQFYRYLGRNTGYRLECSDSRLVQKIRDDVTTLFKTPLLPSQKVLALKRYIIPSFRFALRVRPFTQKDLVSLDRTIRLCVRTAFRFPKNACVSFYHAPCPTGGLGIPSLAVEHDLLTVMHVFKMLSSPDPLVKEAATDRLERVTAKRRPLASREDMAAHLSGLKPGQIEARQSSNSGAPRDIFSRVQRASRRLRVGFRAMEDSSFALSFRETVLSSDDRRNVTRTLHQYQNLVWFEKWSRSPSQGSMTTSLAKYSVSNHWISNPKGITPGAMSFAFKARLSLLPTLNVVNRWSKGPRPPPFSLVSCRGCGAIRESLCHVLQCCKSLAPLHLKRHNSIQDLLVGATPPNFFLRQSIDRRVDPLGNRQRPDVVAWGINRIVVLDVTCAFVSGPDSLEKAAENKRQKYEELCTNLCEESGGKEVQFFPFVVGSLGSWYEGNDRAMAAFGITRRARTALKKVMVTTVINGSNTIWTHFINRFHMKEDRKKEDEARRIFEETEAYIRRRRRALSSTALQPPLTNSGVSA